MNRKKYLKTTRLQHARALTGRDDRAANACLPINQHEIAGAANAVLTRQEWQYRSWNSGLAAMNAVPQVQTRVHRMFAAAMVLSFRLSAVRGNKVPEDPADEGNVVCNSAASHRGKCRAYSNSLIPFCPNDVSVPKISGDFFLRPISWDEMMLNWRSLKRRGGSKVTTW